MTKPRTRLQGGEPWEGKCVEDTNGESGVLVEVHLGTNFSFVDVATELPWDRALMEALMSQKFLLLLR